MDFLTLKGKNILVTGATSGIGDEVVKLLSSFGANLFVTGRNQERLKELAKLQNVCMVIEGDLTENATIERIVDEVESLDGIVNSAGIIYPFPVKFIVEKHIDKVFEINYKAQVLLNSALFRKNKINKGASLVFISSVSSQFPYEGGALYTSSKAALESYAKTVALEYAKNKIRANIVSPGLVKTNIFEETMKASNEEELKRYENNYPLGFGMPEDVANMIAFLLSDRSSWITGQNIIMDGGLTLGSK